MTLLQVLRVALRALGRSKMRSFLTALGIVIGVGAVIAMVALGDGAKARVQQAFDTMGTNMLVIMPGSSSSGGAQGGFGSLPTLTWDDLAAIQTQASAVRYASPYLRTSTSLISEDTNWTTQVGGVSPDYFLIRTWRAARGSLFTNSDVDSSTKVIVLGQTVADKLFGAGIDPVGQQVRVRNVPFQVVGVLSAEGAVAGGPGPRRRRLRPLHDLPRQGPGWAQELHPGHHLRGRGQRGRHLPGRVARSAPCSGTGTTCAAGADDDFAIRNLAEVGQRLSRRAPGPSPPCSPPSPRCRCWWAASGS